MSCGDSSITLPSGIQGANGIQGPAGTNGTSIIYRSFSPVSTSTGGVDILQSYTMPASTLLTLGDSIEILADLYVNVDTSIAAMELWIAGAIVPSLIAGGAFPLLPGAKSCRFRALCSVLTSTTLFIQYGFIASAMPYMTSVYEMTSTISGQSCNTMFGGGATSNVIEIRGLETFGSNHLIAENLVVIKYKV